ncbi:type IV toxin-antitoxin system AbiEi family antitoxin domain-containing protein [Nocardioides sp. GXZ039]|uniref:type IV toxin-antitoxin system AbiEi family antitoxin domain-containing protein n=1 Tax=Nocardioides sp. GXZ039 TaxID=3136018 RepID=UPI0030F3E7C2
MYSRLRQILAANNGVVARSELLDAGLSPSRITELLTAGSIVAERRGVYVDGDLWASLDPYVGRPRLRIRAAVKTLNRGWVLSHDSAALETSMPLLDPTTSRVHITRPGYGSAWTRAGVSHHYAWFDQRHLVIGEDGLRRLDIARTAVDLAREHGELAGLIACDWALRNGVPRTALMEAYLPMAYWPGVRTVRATVERADGRAESPAETLGRDLVEELGIGPVDVQFPVLLDDGRVVWCDLRVGNHVFEVHGRMKYVPAAAGGLAERPVSEVVWEEKKRSRMVRAQGLGVSEILYGDFWGAERSAALKRLRAEYEVTHTRFGAELAPRLAAQAARLRDRLGWRDRAS